MLRKKQLYIMRFEGNNGLVLAKIGISHEPKLRENDLNGMTVSVKTKPKKYSLFAIFQVNDDHIARMIEKEVCHKFKPWTGRELLDTHPERIYAFCKRRVKELGYSQKIAWRVDD